MFGGEYRHSIDGKGRLMIPAKYRDEIAGEALCLVTAFDECLSVYPQSSFREHTKSLTGISSTDRKMMRMKRYILSNMREVNLDPQGIDGQQALIDAETDKYLSMLYDGMSEYEKVFQVPL